MWNELPGNKHTVATSRPFCMLVLHNSGQIVTIFKTALWFACRQTVEKLVFLDSFSLCALSSVDEEKVCLASGANRGLLLHCVCTSCSVCCGAVHSLLLWSMVQSSIQGAGCQGQLTTVILHPH